MTSASTITSARQGRGRGRRSGLMLTAILSVGIVVPGFAQSGAAPAKAPVPVAAPSGVVDARVLGVSESKIDYCTQHDPAAADSLRSRLQLGEHDLDAGQLAALRRSDAYRAAFDAETSFLGRVDDRNAARVCESSPARRRPG